ncbi:hypothetical protein KSF_088280 [Reticulibacter mediterranei]|uniref:TIR domain-containing protein n=1 Tax=Reticulibacter mediterranei TaxID=2778369 RepID=A0A8J3IUK2_9CHLR|nr:protein kinase [Reticulibacter mediterranei]GHO98780.1 hypothetical protein KSF_088280 [Reticulibacter mediterranei]
MKRIGKIVTWCDRAILPGTEWERKISEEIDTADIIILLISPDFMASDYCYGKEMKRAYERHLAGEAYVISILLRPVLWKGTTVSKFQLLPTEGKPVTTWTNHDEAFENIAQGIDQVVEVLLFGYIGGQHPINNNRGQPRQSTGDFPGLSNYISQGAKRVKDPSRLSVPIETGIPKQPTKGMYNTEQGNLARRTVLHNRYMILRTVGRGGMAVVYRARDMQRHTICAIKEMNLAWVSVDERPQAIQIFQREAKILSRLSHPNLPAFHGFFFENQRYFIAMEYIDGSPLEDVLERNDAPFS